MQAPHHSTRRMNVGRLYYGTMRLAVRRSATLAHQIDALHPGSRRSLRGRLAVGRGSLEPEAQVRLLSPQPLFASLL